MSASLLSRGVLGFGALIGAASAAALTMEPAEVNTSSPPPALEFADAGASGDLAVDVAGVGLERDEPTLLQSAAFAGVSGDAEVDFVGDDVVIIADPSGIDVGMPNQFPADRISGHDLKDVRLRYDADTDQLLVAFNSFGIVGDADGDGDPASTGPVLMGLGASDRPSFSLGESFALLIDADQDGVFDVIAGVPSGADLADFQVAEMFLPEALAGSPSLALTYGPALPQHNGGVHGDTSAASPDLVIAIDAFSTLVANDDSLDFGVNVFTGSIDDAGIGEDFIPSIAVATEADIAGTIGDRIWLDGNSNGLQDFAEPGVEDVTVKLFDDDGIELASTQTGADGKYRFEAPAGSYVIEFELPDDHRFTAPGAGTNGDIDSDVTTSTGRSGIIKLAAGEDRGDIDAGVISLSPAVSIQKATNGVDSDTAPGETLTSGSTATFSYVVTNTGNMTLVDLVVTDDVLGAICSIAELGVGASETCTAEALVVPGPYTNVGSVTATPDDGVVVLASISASDPSHHSGSVDAAVDIEKATNGVDADEAPGPSIAPGEDAVFTYDVTNIGNVVLVDLVVTDDQLGEICQIASLEPGATDSCSTATVVVDGPYRNVGTVVGTPMLPSGVALDPVNDTDASHHVGELVGPVCVPDIVGPRMWRGATTVWHAGLEAQAGSVIRIVTSEPGLSPAQPNEQVYVQIGDDLYGPTPAGLGELEITVANTGLLTVLHWSELHTSDMSNSVEFVLCGTGLDAPAIACVADLPGIRLFEGGPTHWSSGLYAEAGSQIVVSTTEPGLSPDQPNEQLYVRIGDDLYGPTPAGLGTVQITVLNAGWVDFEHYSVVNGPQFLGNSVEFTFCGTSLS